LQPTQAPAHEEPVIRTEVEDGRVVLLVGSGSDAHTLSGAILHNMDEGQDVSLRSVGAGALNQAVKAVAIARQVRSAKSQSDFSVAPSFKTVHIDGNVRTALLMTVVGAL
jgi:stage V sporulation protein S